MGVKKQIKKKAWKKAEKKFKIKKIHRKWWILMKGIHNPLANYPFINLPKGIPWRLSAAATAELSSKYRTNAKFRDLKVFKSVG